MNNQFLRKDGESEHAYIYRICCMKDTIGTWPDVAHILNMELGHEYGESAYRKMFQHGKAFYETMSQQDNNEAIQLLRTERELLQKEKMMLQDQRREYNKILREEARYEHLLDVLKSEILLLPQLEVQTWDYNHPTGVEAALLISDIHYGALADNVQNYYDTEVAKERLEHLCQKVIYYCQINRVETLHINLLGDLINGRIHLRAQVESEEDVISQILQVGELLSQFIVKVQKYVPHVKLYGVIGNHSRVEPNKKLSMPVENFERLVFHDIELRTGLIVRLNGLEDWMTYKIKDKNVFISHGDKDSLQNVKMHAINVSGIIPDYCYMGHIHHLEIKDDNGTEVLINGSLMSIDSYAMGLRLSTPPYQIMQIFEQGADTHVIKITM